MRGAILLGLLTAGAYVVASWAGLMVRLPDTNVSPMWPAAGVALGILWRWGWPSLPGLFVGAWLANVTLSGVSVVAGLGFAVGNTASAVLALMLLRWWRASPGLDRTCDPLLLAAASGLGAILSAAVGVLIVWGVLDVPGTLVPRILWTWWSGDAVGAISFAPLVLLAHGLRPPRGQIAEAVALALSVAVAGALVFRPGAHGAYAVLGYLPLVWAALRFGPTGVAWSLAALSLAAILQSAAGGGPYQEVDGVIDRLIRLQALAALAGIGSLTIAAAQTQREALLASLRDSEERYRLVSESSRDLVCLHDPDGRYRWVSPSAKAIVGLDAASLVGCDPYTFFHPDDRERIRREAHTALLDGQQQILITYRFRHADGHWIWFETTSTLIASADGRPAAIQTTSRDVSQRIADQERLQAAGRAAMVNERMAAIGVLAGGVAHEFNNLNAVVLGHAELMLRRDDLPDEMARRLMQIREAVERERGIVEALLAFSRQEHRPGEGCHVSRIARSTLDLARRPLRQRRVQVHQQLPSEAVLVAAAPGALGQVLLNLVLNAADAVDGRPDPQIWIEASAVDDQVVVMVRDNGCGIAAEDLPRIFLPFFSTKGEHAQGGRGQPHLNGTGLGLAVCQTLVDQMRGSISVASVVGQGSTFTLRLPVATVGSSSGLQRARRLHRSLRILVVEDEPEQRVLLRDQLLAEGHRVAEAGNGRQALAALERASYDAVLLDWSMPELDGAGFVDHLSLHPERRWPAVVVLTGWEGSGTSVAGYRNDVAAILRKPCPIDLLRTTLADLLVSEQPIIDLTETRDEDMGMVSGP